MIKSRTSLSDVRSSVRAAFWDLEEVAPPSPSTRKVGGSGFADDPRKIMESLSACTETTPPRAKIVGKSPSALSSHAVADRERARHLNIPQSHRHHSMSRLPFAGPHRRRPGAPPGAS